MKSAQTGGRRGCCCLHKLTSIKDYQSLRYWNPQVHTRHVFTHHNIALQRERGREEGGGREQRDQYVTCHKIPQDRHRHSGQTCGSTSSSTYSAVHHTGMPSLLATGAHRLPECFTTKTDRHVGT